MCLYWVMAHQFADNQTNKNEKRRRVEDVATCSGKGSKCLLQFAAVVVKLDLRLRRHLANNDEHGFPAALQQKKMQRTATPVIE